MAMAIPLGASLGITGLSALGGALANRSSTSTTTPNLSSDQQRLMDMLIAQYTNVSGKTDLTGYQASQTDDINHQAELEKQRLMETLAARGISGSAVNYGKARIDSQRFANITKLRQSVPLLQQDQARQNLNSGAALFSAFPTGSTTKGSGNVAGGGIGNAAGTLAYFLGQGAFNKPGTAPPPTMYAQNFQAPPTNNYGRA